MRGPPGLVLLLLGLPAVASLSVGSGSYPGARSYFEARVDLRNPGAPAILRHLEEVEASLRAHPAAGLSADRRAARARRLDDLRAYRLQGDFPRNLDFPDRLIPYFIDDRGIACAVGQLIIASGDRGLAEDIARTQNHAYLPEIRDPRLPEWANRNGLTLEECARIQPAYAPHYSDVMGLAFDIGNRPWIATGNGVAGSGYVLSRLGTDGWKSPSANYFFPYLSHCMLGERALVVGSNAVSWNGGPPQQLQGGAFTNGHCLAALDGKSFWLGGREGLWRYSVGDTGAPKLEEKVVSGFQDLLLDKVTRLALADGKLWVGTEHGIFHQAAGGAWEHLAVPEAGNSLLGGLKAGGGKSIWFGAYKSKDSWMRPGYAPFSENGLYWQDEQGSPKRYHRGNSPLPGDTVHLAAAGPDNGVWFTVDRKTLLHFRAPGQLTALPFALPSAATRFEVDEAGRLHIGTYAPGMGNSSATGIYRVEGNNLLPLGHPDGSSSIGWSRRVEKGRFEGLQPGFNPLGRNLSGLDALGRRADRIGAAGMYRILPAPKAP